jgi:hypothetical protein
VQGVVVDSKRGALHWLQYAMLPGDEDAEIAHRHLLRSMDALMDHKAIVADCLAQLLRLRIDGQLSVLFCEFTTLRARA